MTHLPVYFINIEQPGASEQFFDAIKVHYDQVWLYYASKYATKLRILHYSRVFLLRQLWIVNYYIKSSSDLSN